jgi:hypothetical protein
MSRLTISIIVCFFSFSFSGLGQNTWIKTFGGTRSDEGNSIVSTIDGGCVVTGTTQSIDGDILNLNKGNRDLIIFKVNSFGNIQWKKVLGGSRGEYGNSISSTTDGGFIVTGKFHSNDYDFSNLNKGQNFGGSDIMVIKLDYKGDIIWIKTIGGFSLDEGLSVTTTFNNECIITGTSKSQDGDFIGMTKNTTGVIVSDIPVIKLDSEGNIIFNINVSGSNEDVGKSIKSTLDGGFILTGYSKSSDGYFKSNQGKNDIFVSKYNNNGILEWNRIIGGEDDDYGVSIIQTSDSGFVLMGNTRSQEGDFIDFKNSIVRLDLFIMKLDIKGTILWKKMFHGNGDDLGYSITNDPDNGFTILGYTGSYDDNLQITYNGDILLLKYDNDGNILKKVIFGGSEDENGMSISSSEDGGYFITGYTNSNDGIFKDLKIGGRDIFVMKLDSNGNLNNTTSINEFSEPTTTLSVHPNPFSNTTTISYKVETPSNISIELLNTLGQTIEVLRNDYSDSGTYQLPLNISNLTSGMYSVRMRSGSMNEVVPVWVVK